MVIKNLCVLVLWTKVVSALEGLTWRMGYSDLTSNRSPGMYGLTNIPIGPYLKSPVQSCWTMCALQMQMV